MTTARIPVDLRNPGQVFACLGFMEAAEVLCGSTLAGFTWSALEAQFNLRVDGGADPIKAALNFVCQAAKSEYALSGHRSDDAGDALRSGQDGSNSVLGAIFPSGKTEKMALPVRLRDSSGNELFLSHWADGSSRDTFKLYAGNRTALKVVNDMTQLIINLRESDNDRLVADPMNTICAMGGSFNFDASGAWNALDAGYSPDRLGHSIQASPVVELFSAIGLENARPFRHSIFEYHYNVWHELLPPILARAALASPYYGITSRRFRLPLFRPNPNSRAVAKAEEEFSA